MTHTVGIDERARLEAIVFGRSTATDAERAAATAALRELLAPAPQPPRESAVDESAAEEEAPVAWMPAVRDLPAPSAVPRRASVVAGLLAVVALVTAIVNTPVPERYVDSLRIFDRAPLTEDVTAAATYRNLPGAGPDLDPATVRVVPEAFPEIVVLVYRTVGGNVCLALMFDDGGGGSCATEADFRAGGLTGGTLFPPSDWRYSWGPQGVPEITAPGA